MKKCLISMILMSLVLSLCSCVGAGDAAPDSMEPQSVPELESIVEPVAEDEPVSAVEDEAEPESVSEPEAEASGLADVAQDLAAVPEPVVNNAPAADLAEPEIEAVPEASEPELLEALAPDFRLDVDGIEKELLRLINALRDREGVNALGIEDQMHLAARIRAAEAFESFSHTRPDGSPYNTAFDEAGFSCAGKWHGENLSSLRFPSGGLTETEIALKMFNGLKDSPGHYRNMTEENFVQAGIGVAVTYTDGMVDVTSAQMFSGL